MVRIEQSVESEVEEEVEEEEHGQDAVAGTCNAVFPVQASTESLGAENGEHAYHRNQELRTAAEATGSKGRRNGRDPVEYHQTAVDNVHMPGVGDACRLESRPCLIALSRTRVQGMKESQGSELDQLRCSGRLQRLV